MNKTKLKVIAWLAGFSLISYAVFIYIISPNYTYAADPSLENIVFYITIRIVIGIVYAIAAIVFIKNLYTSKKNIFFVFFIGLFARIILVPSEPILEDDFNRYLWDGAVTVNGYNPYKYAPKNFIEENYNSLDSLAVLHKLAEESGDIIKKVNHPHIRTIYPPVAQVACGISYIIKPWSTSVWKSILVVIDITVFLLLIVLLQKLNYPKIFVIIYWWNPVLLHEIFNAGHMDILMYPLILLGILFVFKNKYVMSSLMMALSVGVKIWPVTFLPIVYRKIFHNKKILFISFLVSLFVITLILLPILLTKLDDSLGFVTYSKNWTNNEAVFQIVNYFVKKYISYFEINYHCSLCASRWVVISFLGLIIGYFSVKSVNDNKIFIQRLFLIVAIIYIISPTQFPWYYTWVLPILVLNPRLSFIFYAITLPLYQLKFHWHYLVWIEHIPIVLLFIVELFNKKVGEYLLPDNIKKNF